MMRYVCGLAIALFLLGGCVSKVRTSAHENRPDAGGHVDAETDAGADDDWDVDSGSIGDAANGDAGLPGADAAGDDAGDGAAQDASTSDADDTRVDVDEPPADSGDGPGGDGPSVIKKTFRVLHWNIAGGKENNCNATRIAAAVVQYVRDRNLDFVGLNEVCPSQYREIRSRLRRYWGKGASAKFSAYVGDETGRVVGNAIFSRFNIRDVTRQKVGQDQWGHRNLLCARLNKYRHLRFCSTHLTPGDATARVQMGRVRSRIEGWWRNRRDTVILTGDLNLHANDHGLNNIYSANANHSRNNPNNRGRYREVDDNDRSHCRGYGERSLPGTAGGPCRDGGKIDFIFVRENRIVDGNYVGDTFNIPTTCTGKCSDHRPVYGRARLKIRPN
jgi:endonuclease/exonuclease/phosphatase family metal-dependent hydrolase